MLFRHLPEYRKIQLDQICLRGNEILSASTKKEIISGLTLSVALKPQTAEDSEPGVNLEFDHVHYSAAFGQSS